MSIATPLDKEDALGSTHMCTLCTLHYNNTLSSQLFHCRNNPFHESLKLIFRAPFPISPRTAGAESSWFQKQNHWENNKFIISRGEQNRIIFGPCLVKQSGMGWKTFSTALLVTLELLRTSVFTSPVLRCHTACQEITDHVCHQLIHASGWSWEDECFHLTKGNNAVHTEGKVTYAGPNYRACRSDVWYLFSSRLC